MSLNNFLLSITKANCYVIVGTKLQAAIVERMVDCGLIKPPFHLIKRCTRDSYNNGDRLDRYCEKLHPFITGATRLVRSKLGFFKLLAFFLLVQIHCRIFGKRIYLSSINHYPFALALKVIPGLRVYTFDDGSANVQLRDSSYLTQTASQQRGFKSVFARWIFPRGPSAAVRDKIERHCTIYPGIPNIADASRIDTIDMRWDLWVGTADAALLPRNVRKILLGTLYGVAAEKLPSFDFNEHDLEWAMRWSDCYIPHPRDAAANMLPDVLQRYPAEAIIAYYSALRPITVAHFNSSTALSFLDKSNVTLIDLCDKTVLDAMRQSAIVASQDSATGAGGLFQ